MHNVKLHQVIWNIRQAQRRFGWVGVAGVVLLICGLAYYLSVVRPAVNRLDEFRLQAASLDKLTHSTKGTSTPVGEQISAFHEFFPKSRQSPELLAKIYSAAAKQGVTLGQGEYRVAHDQGRLLRYEVNLPIKAEYLQIRKFINQVLGDIPSASLDNVSFQRQHIFDPVLETQIKFTIFMEGD